MKISEFFDWVDDFDIPTETNWHRLVKAAFWVLFLAVAIGSYCYLYYIFFGD